MFAVRTHPLGGKRDQTLTSDLFRIDPNANALRLSARGVLKASQSLSQLACLRRAGNLQIQLSVADLIEDFLKLRPGR